MAIETAVPRSRRALLAASLGGLAALAAQALGRPAPARAINGDFVTVGSTVNGTATTKIANYTTSNTVFWGASSAGTGVYGTSSSSNGVLGESSSGFGVYGSSSSSYGVLGDSNSSYGVCGGSFATDQPAMVAQSFGNSTGLLGYSGSINPPAAPAKTGVYGYAVQDASSRGVTGRTTAGRGVNGLATSGIGVYAAAGTSGTAFHAQGRVSFSTAGLATIGAGTASAVVSPGLDLTSSSKILCTLEGNPGPGVTIHRVVKNTADDYFTIYLTAAAANNVKVAWFLIG